MDYTLLKSNKINKSLDCIVVGVIENQPLPEQIAQIIKSFTSSLPPLIKRIEKNGDFVLHTSVTGPSVLVIHCGEAAQFSYATLKKRIGDVISVLTKQRIQDALIYFPELAKQDPNWQLHQTILAFDDALYQMLDFKTVNRNPYELQSIAFIAPDADLSTINHAKAAAEGIRFTRNLANLPANICTPSYLAQQAEELAKQFSTIKTTVMDLKAIEKMKMGSFLSVARGSIEKPQFIEIQYNGSNNTEKPIVLIGKGVTFDSGGISLKPSAGMEEMKFDMAGAASVLGTIKAIALQKLPIHVIGLIPATENMPSGSATKPGDIVTSMSGKTIEIVNTDAEGRLILADTLTYAERFKPKFVIDIATLTGAVIIALGHETTGLLTEDDELADLVLTAAERSKDATWRLPLNDDYQPALDSPIADMVNSTADRGAGSIKGACFLSRFADKYSWAHLDIAGTAWVSGQNRNATGRPVPLLLEILNHVATSR